jgi:patatin-like phospholipase
VHDGPTIVRIVRGGVKLAKAVTIRVLEPFVRIISAIGVAVVLTIVVVVVRKFTGLGRYYKAVGVEIKGDVDLNDPKPFIKLRLGKTAFGLACSGGGSRAAYLTAAIVREIHRSHVGVDIGDGDSRDLIGQLDMVSSVSGGSLAAAYLVANINQLENANADDPPWQDYVDKMAFSYRPAEWYRFRPFNWLRFVFTNYNRGLMARDDYDERLFPDQTLAKLRDRPALYLNAFDVGNHVRFVFSRNYINTYYFQPRWAGNVLDAPQDFTSENDLTYCRVDPNSVSLADSTYASSAYPIFYTNLALNHFGQAILFKGRLIFLADGGLADNSGLLTLFTQMKAAIDDDPQNGILPLAVYVDASTDWVGRSGSPFQESGIENEYAWSNTWYRQGEKTIDAAIAIHQDAAFQFLASTGVFGLPGFPDSSFLDNPGALSAEPPTTQASRAVSPKAAWGDLMNSGKVALRPCVIALGLSDIHDAYYNIWGSNEFGKNPEDPRLIELFARSGIQNSKAAWSDGPYSSLNEQLKRRLREIPTDFALSRSDRAILDLAAYILVHGKLENELADWSSIAKDARLRQDSKDTSPNQGKH